MTNENETVPISTYDTVLSKSKAGTLLGRSTVFHSLLKDTSTLDPAWHLFRKFVALFSRSEYRYKTLRILSIHPILDMKPKVGATEFSSHNRSLVPDPCQIQISVFLFRHSSLPYLSFQILAKLLNVDVAQYSDMQLKLTCKIICEAHLYSIFVSIFSVGSLRVSELNIYQVEDRFIKK